MKASYKIAMAAGQDAGNKRMLSQSRTSWDEEDWNTAAKVTSQLIEDMGGEMTQARFNEISAELKVAEIADGEGNRGRVTDDWCADIFTAPMPRYDAIKAQLQAAGEWDPWCDMHPQIGGSY